MTMRMHHRGDRLVVPFEGELDWPRATALVDAVDAHLEHYHYRRVELVVASPGGLVAALEHVMRALVRWRARGVEVRTRVVASAESAAAVLVSLGDERTAAPGARLLYHLSRVPEAGAITARASAELHGALSRTDAHIVSRLVERALAARGPVPHRAEPRDREALERIVGALAGHAPTRGRRARLKRLAERAGRALDAAVRSGDRDTVTLAYRALARVDRPISAALARTLRLIDRIDDAPDAHDAPDARAIALTIPEWRSLFPPSGAVPRALLTRHLLALGRDRLGEDRLGHRADALGDGPCGVVSAVRWSSTRSASSPRCSSGKPPSGSSSSTPPPSPSTSWRASARASTPTSPRGGGQARRCASCCAPPRSCPHRPFRCSVRIGPAT